MGFPQGPARGFVGLSLLSDGSDRESGISATSRGCRTLTKGVFGTRCNSRPKTPLIPANRKGWWRRRERRFGEHDASTASPRRARAAGLVPSASECLITRNGSVFTIAARKFGSSRELHSQCSAPFYNEADSF